MSQRERRRDVHAMLLLSMVGALVFAILPSGGALGRTGAAPVHAEEVRTVWTGEFGLDHPVGLTFVESLGELLVVDGDASALRLGFDEDARGLVELGDAANPATVGYDAATDRVVMLGDGVQAALPAASLKSQRPTFTRSPVGGIEGLDGESAAYDSESGAWLVVSQSDNALVRVSPGEQPEVDSVSLESVSDANLVAVNADDDLTYVLDDRGMLTAVNDEGTSEMTYDLGSVDLVEPTAMVFAPTSDATDEHDNLNLFIADSGGSERSGGVVEVSLATVTAAAVPVDNATLVRLTATSGWTPGSPDPSGVTYLQQSDELLVVDSEVDEITGAGWHDVNMWRTTRSGSQRGTGTFWGSGAATFGGKVGFSREPTGAGYDPSGQRLFVSDDSAKKVFAVGRGPDSLFGTSDDPVSAIDVAAFGSTDTEDPDFDVATGHLFILDGVGMEIYRINPVDGLFGNGNDVKTQFDISHLGPRDFEGLAYNPSRDTLYVGARSTETIYEITKTGTILRQISLSGITGLRFISGLGVAPASDGSGTMNFYVVDRAVDNGANSSENDGKLFEVKAPDSLGGGTVNQAPAVNAGPDQSVTMPNAATLTGSVSDDGLPAGSQVTQNWSVVSAPSGGQVVFSAPDSATTSATFSVAGSYRLRLSATDSELSSSDDVNVQVNPESGGGSDSVAVSQSTLYGTVTGGLENTYFVDGAFQVLTEETNARGLRARLEHTWRFDLTGGSQVVFALNGFTSEGEGFRLSHSLNGGSTWKNMTAWSGSSGVEYRYTMPAGTTGTVMIRIKDTNRTRSDTVRDTVNVDRAVFTGG